MPLVGKPAPNFKEKALVGQEFKTISLSDFKGKYVILLFYPLDFTFVCPTEIIAFSERIEEFRKVNCEVLGVSVDSVYTHLAWVNTPRKEGGLGQINYPLISDLNKKMSRDYDVLLEEEGHTLRGLYIIDGKGIVRNIILNEPPVGRNVDEALRLVQASQFADIYGEVCPVNWKPGEPTMKPNPQQSKEYFHKVNK
jgi:alkyl hydroperoxide reductase subunit AhpC